MPRRDTSDPALPFAPRLLNGATGFALSGIFVARALLPSVVTTTSASASALLMYDSSRKE
jgi:hypothetical protein